MQLIPIGLTTALAQSSAIYVTLLSPLILGEKIGLIRWTAVTTGLIGVFLMINPIDIVEKNSELSSLGLFLAFGSAVTHAGLALILRKIGKTEHPASTALIHNLITSVIIILAIIFFGTKFYGTPGKYGIRNFGNNKFYFLFFNLFRNRGIISAILNGTKLQICRSNNISNS